MIIDTHCHIDMYENPLEVALECENEGIITIGMTNLPSHFEMGQPHLLGFKKVRLALGMHPLFAESHTVEWMKFKKNINKTSYIGEIGLDFSRKGIQTKSIQIDTFKKILNEIRDKKKILSLHSRKAEKEVLQYLKENNIKFAIFHWYSGPTSLIKEIENAGYYFSVNTSMINTKSGQEILKNISKEKLLTESDGPFIEFKGKIVKSSDIIHIHSYLSKLWNMSMEEVGGLIYGNFKTILLNLN